MAPRTGTARWPVLVRSEQFALSRAAMKVYSVDHPELAPLEMPERFRHDVAYFMTPAGDRGAPQLAPGEFWIDPQDVRTWLDEGVLRLVSPLDSENKAEVELSEDHERWLEWIAAHEIRHVRFGP